MKNSNFEQAGTDLFFREQTFSLEILQALATSYLTMHLIDLKRDTIVEITATTPVRKFWTCGVSAQNQLIEIYKKLLPEAEKKRVFDFVNLETLPKRLYGKKLLSIEYLSMYRGWVRSTFVPVKYDENGFANFLIYYTRTIDEEKRREEELIFKMNKDELTELFNRHAFEEAVKTLNATNVSDNTVFFSVDMNSLKEINDQKGHDAGDKVLRAAADCLKNTIGKYGNIYRIGGDEFVGIVQMDASLIHDTKVLLKKECKKWSEENGLPLYLSIGVITKCHHKDLSLNELLKFADKRMYRDKANFYSKSGLDRRSLNVAFTTISKSYTKILKVNLDDETHEIYKINFSATDYSDNLSDKISVWIENFIKNNGLHPDDIEAFKNFMDVKKIKEHFLNDKEKSILRIFYRRKDGNDYKKVMTEIIPADDFDDENKVVFFCIKNIE